MELTYDLMQKDSYNAFIAHRERSAVSKWSFRFLSGLVFLISAIGLLTLITDHQTKFVSVVPLFALAAFWALFIWGTPLWSARANSCNNLPPKVRKR